jgi:hypothetical protein
MPPCKDPGIPVPATTIPESGLRAEAPFLARDPYVRTCPAGGPDADAGVRPATARSRAAPLSRGALWAPAPGWLTWPVITPGTRAPRHWASQGGSPSLRADYGRVASALPAWPESLPPARQKPVWLAAAAPAGPARCRHALLQRLRINLEEEVAFGRGTPRLETHARTPCNSAPLGCAAQARPTPAGFTLPSQPTRLSAPAAEIPGPATDGLRPAVGQQDGSPLRYD